MNATILDNEIAVTYHDCLASIGREFLHFSITGWDDVKKIKGKVLLYNGKKFVFSGWNSDNMTCCFVHIPGVTGTAKISKK